MIGRQGTGNCEPNPPRALRRARGAALDLARGPAARAGSPWVRAADAQVLQGAGASSSSARSPWGQQSGAGLGLAHAAPPTAACTPASAAKRQRPLPRAGDSRAESQYSLGFSTGDVLSQVSGSDTIHAPEPGSDDHGGVLQTNRGGCRPLQSREERSCSVPSPPASGDYTGTYTVILENPVGGPSRRLGRAGGACPGPLGGDFRGQLRDRATSAGKPAPRGALPRNCAKTNRLQALARPADPRGEISF